MSTIRSAAMPLSQAIKIKGLIISNCFVDFKLNMYHARCTTPQAAL